MSQNEAAVIVAPGRTVSHGITISPQVTVPGPDGEVQILSAAVVKERSYGPGEMIILPHGEAAHLVASGAAVFPNTDSSFAFAAPRLRDDPGAVEPPEGAHR